MTKKINPTEAQTEAAVSLTAPSLATSFQRGKIEMLLEMLNEEPFNDEMFDAMSFDDAQRLIKSLVIQTVKPANVEPVKDFATHVRETNASIAESQMLTLSVTKTFAQTQAYDVVTPPSDSVYLKKEMLVGVTFTCISVSVHDSSFAPEAGKARSRVAEYKILVHQRLDLGERIITLGNALSIAQANSLPPSAFPFIATLEYGETRGTYSPPFVMSVPRKVQEHYIHPNSENIVSSNY